MTCLRVDDLLKNAWSTLLEPVEVIGNQLQSQLLKPNSSVERLKKIFQRLTRAGLTINSNISTHVQEYNKRKRVDSTFCTKR
jgi:hypothetical protein